MDLELNDKVVFVAGSSRGIGLAISAAFANEGARVVITGRDAASLEAAAQELKSHAGAERIHAIQSDMSDAADIRRAVDEAVSVFGGLDAVVANVGSGAGPSGWELGIQDWETALKENLAGSMLLAGATLSHLAQRENSSLTFIASIAGFETLNAPLPYGAAKAGLIHGMKALSRLAAKSGVRVNAVAPGNILFPQGSWERKLRERPEFFEQYIKSEVPLQRFGRPEEVADAVLFLSSPRATFITGACLVVDGGQTHSF